MGQQQLILILLAILLIGVAIAAGLGLFSSNQAENNKLAIINDLNNLKSLAFKYRRRPLTMAGGAGTYSGFILPTKLATNPNAAYTMTVAADAITVVATSNITPTNTITVVIDSEGKLINWTYTGSFQ